MSKQPGLFGRTNKLIINTVDNADKVVNNTLGMASGTTKAALNFVGELANDTSDDLVDSRVRLLTKRAGHKAELIKLGYNEEECNQLLDVEMH